MTTVKAWYIITLAFSHPTDIQVTGPINGYATQAKCIAVINKHQPETHYDLRQCVLLTKEAMSNYYDLQKAE